MVIIGHINEAAPAALAASTASLDPRLSVFHFDVDGEPNFEPTPGIGARTVGVEAGPGSNCDVDSSRLIFANTYGKDIYGQER